MVEGPTFEVETSRDGNRAVLTARGEIDLATVQGLQDAFDAVVRAGANEVRLDLTEVEFMDSTGLSALVNGHRALCGRLIVICPDGAPRRALEVSGLGELIRVCSSMTDAA
jgi:anti-anti-sigma factor